MCFRKEQCADSMNAKEAHWILIFALLDMRYVQGTVVNMRRERMMSEIKLRPCPCCDTEPYTHFTELKHNELHGFISCNNSNCALKMNFVIKPSRTLLNFDDVINGMHDIADRWNRRVGEQNE